MKAKDGSVVTIGVFDGVHIGHRKIIREVVEAAKKARLKSIVVTFDPHPVKVVKAGSKVPSLISLKHRVRLIKELGVDTIVVLRFTKYFSRLTPEKFVRCILMERLGARLVYVGEDFHFGKGAGAGTALLKKISRGLALEIRVVKPVKALGRIVSSSLIRKRVSEGKLEDAKALLGRPASVLGTVVSGAGLAKYLGYPTANLNPHHEVIPPTGVYAVKVKYGNRLFNGILNIGARPTFFSPRDKEPEIEVHIFNFKGSLYGKDIEILFVRKIRQERKFRTVADLVAEIKKDEKKALQILEGMLT